MFFKKYFLIKICDENSDIKENYGNISSASITTILRNIAELEQQGGNFLIGSPALDVNELIMNDANDNGLVSIIRLTQVQDKPALFSTFIIYLLSKLYTTLPEVGDLEKPKLVMFIDEAYSLGHSEGRDSFSKECIDTINENDFISRMNDAGISLISMGNGKLRMVTHLDFTEDMLERVVLTIENI